MKNFRLLLPRGGLGNRLRFIDSSIRQSSKTIYVLWPVNSECSLRFHDYFETSTQIKVHVICIGSWTAFALNITNYIFANILNSYSVTRDDRRYRDDVIFDSSVHSYTEDVNRFFCVRFSKEKISNLFQNKYSNEYYVFYLRGLDNKVAIETTNYQKILDNLVRLAPIKSCIGLSDDSKFKAILKSYGAMLLREGDESRDDKKQMLNAIQDLFTMSQAKEVHASNYSSFAELSYSLSSSSKLIIYSSANIKMYE